MHYHLVLTDQCNLHCRYCYQKSVEDVESQSVFTFDFSAPSTFDVDVTTLKTFLEKDDNPVVIFYGGEPLLEMEKMKEIIDCIDVPFRMQTNGLLLDNVPKTYLNKMQKILVSVDGDKKRTDYNRGQGTYDTVMNNISSIKPWYTGEIVARMTIAQDCPDIHEQVVSLVDHGFSSVHWQLDAGFYHYDFDEEKFTHFVNEYNKGISTLINYWITEMEKGCVLTLYPFVGIAFSLLTKEKATLRCGAGHTGYCITTNGTLVACPITTHIKEFAAGTLTTHPLQLKKFTVSGRCIYCDIRNVCGGRCLYWNKACLWPEKGDDLICKTISHLVKELKNKIPVIKELIRNGVIQKDDFMYEKYFGPEIIP